MKDFFLKSREFSFLTKEEIAFKNLKNPNKIQIIYETEFFAVLFKPSGIPTAPLKKDETAPLLSWFLTQRKEAKIVKGKKEIEAGLIHRLDTPTAGLVLIAKTQAAYNFFINLQNKNLIEKKYIAIVDNLNAQDFKPPKKIISQFRPFGPGQKKVAPIFDSEKRFLPNGKIYTTSILDFDFLNNQFIASCSLTKGYRHQVRTHLASIGLAIKGDALYNKTCIEDSQKELQKHSYKLQLYAVGISIKESLPKEKSELFSNK